MNSVQENKNELEAAVRYCESAISRAKSTIESMEFRQQAATKAWHEQTGREESLTKKLAVMTDKYDKMKGYADQLLDENGTMEAKYEEAKTNMALMTDELEELRERNDELKPQLVEWRDRSSGYTKEIGELNSELEAMSKAYNAEVHETTVWKKSHRKLQEVNNLQKEQIEMFQRKMSRMNEVDR